MPHIFFTDLADSYVRHDAQDICMGKHRIKCPSTYSLEDVVVEARKIGASGFVRRAEGMWYIIDPDFARTPEELAVVQQTPRKRGTGLRGTHPDGTKFTSYILL
jgi:hypothetical protein